MNLLFGTALAFVILLTVGFSNPEKTDAASYPGSSTTTRDGDMVITKKNAKGIVSIFCDTYSIKSPFNGTKLRLPI